MDAIVGDRGAPQKHVRRCHIVLLTADDLSIVEIMLPAGLSQTAV